MKFYFLIGFFAALAAHLIAYREGDRFGHRMALSVVTFAAWPFFLFLAVFAVLVRDLRGQG